MKEIYENGPIVVAINAAPDLYYYSSGIFITNPTNNLSIFYLNLKVNLIIEMILILGFLQIMQ